MKNFLFTIGIIFSICNQQAFSQSVVIRPKFKLGDSLTYIVTQKEKASDLFTFSRGTHQFRATFKIQDTTNGYSINFKTKLIQPISDKYSSELMLDKLRDGIDLTYKMNDSGWLIDIVNYKYCQQRSLDLFDSIYFVSDYPKTDRLLLQSLRGKLERPEGLQMLLEPVILFNEIYLDPPFRNRNDYHASSTVNIFYEPQITGTLITNLKKFDQQSNSATVSVDFIANADSAAKKIIPIFNELIYKVKGKIPKGLPEDVKFEIHSLFNISLDNTYATSLFKKTEATYILKNTSEIRMELTHE